MNTNNYFFNQSFFTELFEKNKEGDVFWFTVYSVTLQEFDLISIVKCQLFSSLSSIH